MSQISALTHLIFLASKSCEVNLLVGSAAEFFHSCTLHKRCSHNREHPVTFLCDIRIQDDMRNSKLNLYPTSVDIFGCNTSLSFSLVGLGPPGRKN
jgi:hypothetical protein